MMRLIKNVLLIGMTLVSIRINAQVKSKTMTKESIVTTFLKGFDDQTKIGESLNLLADDYHFTSPTDENNSKVEFIEAATEVAKILTGLDINHMAVSGNWVVVNYTFKSSIKGLENTKGNEWFRVEDGKIQESHLIYDASEWRKIFTKVE